MTRPDPRGLPRDVPDLLFHGTSHWTWTEIQAMDAMLDDERQPSGGICFSDSRRVAEEFARLACQRHDDPQGVIIAIDGPALAHRQELQRHRAELPVDWTITDERDWRVPVARLDGILAVLSYSWTVARESWDESESWGRGADDWNAP